MKHLASRTDLAAEAVARVAPDSGVLVREHSFSHGSVHIVDVTTDAAADALGKPCGRYITLSTGRVWLMDTAGTTAVATTLAALFSDLLRHACPTCKKLLFVGLGNRHLTVDAIGARVLDRLQVTRGLPVDVPPAVETAAITPGVVGQTGIETVELVRGAVTHVKPDAVLAIDALAARDTERLATTIQLSDTGISPGSGMGNHRLGLNRETLGVPVLALGVPTIVDSATLITEALAAADMDVSDFPKLANILENGRSFFVTRKDSDLAVETLADVIARALAEVQIP